MSVREVPKAEILAKKDELAKAILETSKNITNTRSSPAKKFLLEIKDLVKQSFEKGITARQLSKQIFSVYNFKISEQTIKNFASKELGIETKIRGKK